jgi:hypothetical protein
MIRWLTLLLLLLAVPAQAATNAQFIEFGPYFSGGLLVNGAKVYQYVAGTTTGKDCWTTRSKAATVAQPIVADSQGIVSMYCDGVYKFVITTSADVTMYTFDNVVVIDAFEATGGEGAALTAASTLTLGTDGNYFNVSGSVGITAISGSQAYITLTFLSSVTLTHSSSLVLAGARSVTANAGDTYGFVNDGAGVWREAYRAVANTPTVLPGGYIYGCTISNNVTDATNDIDISDCEAAHGTTSGTSYKDFYSRRLIKLTPLTKRLDEVYAAGTDQGCRLSAESLADGTWHVFAFRPSTGADDVFCSQSVTPTAPSGGTIYRRIGSIIRSSGAILAFVQDGSYFRLKVCVANFADTNPGASAVLKTMTVPAGISVMAVINATLIDTGTTEIAYLSDPDATDAAPSTTVAPFFNLVSQVANVSGGTQLVLRTNTSQQIRYRLGTGGANSTIRAATCGWLDARGKNKPD